MARLKRAVQAYGKFITKKPVVKPGIRQAGGAIKPAPTLGQLQTRAVGNIKDAVALDQGNRQAVGRWWEAAKGYTPPPAPEPTTPFDPAYESAMGSINQKYGNLVGQYKYGTEALEQSYGLDENGTEITDPNSPLFNPFNKMALLRESFNTANRATTGQMAERGGLYSGALQSRLDNQQHGYDISQDTLKRDFGTGRHGLLDMWLSGIAALGDEKTVAEQGRTDRQLATPPPPTAKPPALAKVTPQATKNAISLLQSVHNQQQKDLKAAEKKAAKKKKKGKK